MSSGEIAFLSMVVGAITLFGGVLAWASWMEARDSRSSQRQRQSRAAAEKRHDGLSGSEMQLNKHRAF